MFRRFVAIFLTMVLLLVFLPSSAMATDIAVHDVTVPVKMIGDTARTYNIHFRVRGDNVYANSAALGAIFGYSCGKSAGSVLFYNESNLSYMAFYNQSTSVVYCLGLNPLRYDAPFETIIEGNGEAWIPFEFFLLLADSSYVLSDGKIYLEPARYTGVKLLKKMMREGIGAYGFDILDELGGDETSLILRGGSANLVNFLDGILGFEPAAWGMIPSSIAGSNTFDEKYGNTMATMLCTNSQSELVEFAKMEQANALYDIIDLFADKRAALDINTGDLLDQCNSLLGKMQSANPPTITYNRLYQRLESVVSDQEALSTFAEPLSRLKDQLPSEETIMAVSYLLQGAAYAAEFAQQDEFSVNALDSFLRDIDKNTFMPDGTKVALRKGVDAFRGDIVNYAISKIVADNWVDMILSATGLEKALLGAQGIAAKAVWDFASATIPYLRDGLSSADSFELALYALLLQTDSMQVYFGHRDNCLYGEMNNKSGIEKSMLSAYTFLKSCLIAREAGIESVKSSHDNVPEYIDSLREKNRNICRILGEIKHITASDDHRMYGFTRDLALKYLVDYDDMRLRDTILSYRETVSGESIDIYSVIDNDIDEISEMLAKEMKFEEGYTFIEDEETLVITSQNGKHIRYFIIKGNSQHNVAGIRIGDTLKECIEKAKEHFIRVYKDLYNDDERLQSEADMLFSEERRHVDNDYAFILSGNLECDVSVELDEAQRVTRIEVGVIPFSIGSWFELLEQGETYSARGILTILPDDTVANDEAVYLDFDIEHGEYARYRIDGRFGETQFMRLMVAPDEWRQHNQYEVVVEGTLNVDKDHHLYLTSVSLLEVASLHTEEPY